MFDNNELNQLYRYALSLCKQEDTAYDILQSALERYLCKADGGVEKPMAFLKTVIRNIYFDLERHNKVIIMVAYDDQDEISLAEDDRQLDELLINEQQAHQVINALNAEENELLYLWAVEEYTADEIAKIYDKPRGTVLSKLHRLKKRIKTFFAETELVEGVGYEEHKQTI